MHRLEPFAGHVDRRAVGQVAAGGEVEAHEGVAGLQQRQEHRLVGLAARVRLDVGEAAAEQLLGALDGERLGDVDELAAAVIAPARIALGVFVGQHRALRLEHGAGDDVFRGDELDLVALALELVVDRAGDLRIGLRQGGGEERVFRVGGGGGGLGHGRDVADSSGGRQENHLVGRRNRQESRATRFGRPGDVNPESLALRTEPVKMHTLAGTCRLVREISRCVAKHPERRTGQAISFAPILLKNT